MPKLKSSKKRLLSNRRSQRRNRAVRSRMRSAIRGVDAASDSATGQEALMGAYSAIDKSVKLGTIHKNTAARYKSRLARKIQSIS